jgi:hypothetical protein
MKGGSLKSIWRRDGRKCWICGRMVAKDDASRDHLEPRSGGGYDKSKNYAIAHKLCNGARGSLPKENVIATISAIEGTRSPEIIRQALRFAKQEYYRLNPKSK